MTGFCHFLTDHNITGKDQTSRNVWGRIGEICVEELEQGLGFVAPSQPHPMIWLLLGIHCGMQFGQTAVVVSLEFQVPEKETEFILLTVTQFFLASYEVQSKASRLVRYTPFLWLYVLTFGVTQERGSNDFAGARQNEQASPIWPLITTRYKN